jgi:hypothetical protein
VRRAQRQDLPSWSREALQEVLVRLERRKHTEFAQRRPTFSTCRDLWVASNELVNLSEEPKRYGACGKVCSQISIMTLSKAANLTVVSVCDGRSGQKLPRLPRWARTLVRVRAAAQGPASVETGYHAMGWAAERR